MQCTDPLPYDMSDFRFRGIDGRGSVKLVQDPRNNNGMAVIRIDDPKGGSEGYTFDIEWSGASGGAPTGGFSSGASSSAISTTATDAVKRGADRSGPPRESRPFRRACDRPLPHRVAHAG